MTHSSFIISVHGGLNSIIGVNAHSGKVKAVVVGGEFNRVFIYSVSTTAREIHTEHTHAKLVFS